MEEIYVYLVNKDGKKKIESAYLISVNPKTVRVQLKDGKVIKRSRIRHLPNDSKYYVKSL